MKLVESFDNSKLRHCSFVITGIIWWCNWSVRTSLWHANTVHCRLKDEFEPSSVQKQWTTDKIINLINQILFLVHLITPVIRSPQILFVKRGSMHCNTLITITSLWWHSFTSTNFLQISENLTGNEFLYFQFLNIHQHYICNGDCDGNCYRIIELSPKQKVFWLYLEGSIVDTICLCNWVPNDICFSPVSSA